MIDNTLRHGRFTSSRIADLTTTSARPMTELELAEWKAKNPKSRKTTIEDWPGVAALSYIEEKRFERKLKRSLNSGASSRPTEWGTCCESVAFSLMDTSFEIVSENTIVHPLYDFWAGSPDIKSISQKKIGDVKCPYTLKSFCQLVDDGLSGGIQEIRDRHKEGETYYKQIVSNACIHGYTKGVLVVFAPKKGEKVFDRDVMEVIYDESDTYGFNWIRFANEQSLPIIPQESDYEMLNLIEFEIPQSDIDYLTECVLKAEAMLTKTLRIYDQNVTIYESMAG